jgi:hypothetical protein
MDDKMIGKNKAPKSMIDEVQKRQSMDKLKGFLTSNLVRAYVLNTALLITETHGEPNANHDRPSVGNSGHKRRDQGKHKDAIGLVNVGPIEWMGSSKQDP